MKNYLKNAIWAGVLSMGLSTATHAAYWDPAGGLVYDNLWDVPCPLCYTVLPIGNDSTDGASDGQSGFNSGAESKFGSTGGGDLFSVDKQVFEPGFGPALSKPATSAVPIPAAVWLLGSALVGLGLIRRRT